MTEVTNNDVLLGKLLANQETMQTQLTETNTKLDAIEVTLREYEKTVSYIKGQRSVVIWVGGAIIAASAAVGLSASKVFAWLAAHTRI